MLRLGLIDFDSSHAVEFTRRMNHVGVSADQWVDGARVVLGWPGTSEMAPQRIANFTRQVADCGVALVEDPQSMIGEVDAVLVLSLCGAAHRERVTPFLQAGIPAFVDKPFACSLADALAMSALAHERQVALMSVSALRFSEEVLAFQRRQTAEGPLPSMVSYGPGWRAAGNPSLFHYGIHAVELLLTLMGPGCAAVSATSTEGADLLTCRWHDGRTAVLRAARHGSSAYGFLAFCERGVVPQTVSTRYAYRNLCREIVKTFTTGQPTVPPEDTLDVVKLILAAEQSERSGGELVRLDTLAADS